MSKAGSSEGMSSSSKKPSRDRLFVVGAGLSRSGTETMCEAMEILLKMPAYHGGTMIISRGRIEELLWCWDDPKCVPDFNGIFDERPDGTVYGSCFDFPCNVWVKELISHYPNSRVVLMKRNSAEEWADSMRSTVIPLIGYVKLANRLTFGLFETMRKALRFTDGEYMRRGFGFGSDGAPIETLTAFYEQHLEKIRKLVPDDRLIELNANDGWEPLCNGLNLPIPSVPFPRKNERSGFMNKFGPMLIEKMSKITGADLLRLTVLILILALLFQLFK